MYNLDGISDGTRVKRRGKMERMSKIDGQRLSSQGGAIEKRHSHTEGSPLIDENEEWAKVRHKHILKSLIITGYEV